MILTVIRAPYHPLPCWKGRHYLSRWEWKRLKSFQIFWFRFTALSLSSEITIYCFYMFMLVYYFLNLWILSIRNQKGKKKCSAEDAEKYSMRKFLRTISGRPKMPFSCHLGLSATAGPGIKWGAWNAGCVCPCPCLVFLFLLHTITDNESWLAVGFPFTPLLSFPFAGSHGFLAQSCCVWALICQAVINSKKNLFLLNYFWNVMQTCLNYVAANSALRSGFDFMLIQVGERKKETKTQNGDMPSFIL